MKKLREYILIQRYLWKIKRKLKYPRKAKRTTIHGFSQFIFERLREEDTIQTMQDAYDLFGTPQRVTEQWMELITEAEAQKYNREIRVVRSILITISIPILLILAFLIWNYFDKMNMEIVSRSGTIIEVVDGTTYPYLFPEEEAHT